MVGKDLLLVYDIGTTGLKCVVFSAQGQELLSASATYQTYYPGSGWAEQEAADFWTAAQRATAEILTAGTVQANSIAVIGLSGHMNGCLPVSAEGLPLHREIIHADSRSVEERKDIQRIIGQKEYYELTGNRVDEHLSLPKILWIKKNFPEVYRNTAFFINSKDYLRYRLTGRLGQTDFSDASLVCAMDIKQRRWSNPLLRELGLDTAMFPELHKSSEICGPLNREASRALALPEGIPVVFGGGDAACATRGAGVRDLSSAYAYIGSSAWISTLAPGPVGDPQQRTQNFFDLDPRKCNVCGTVQNAGIAVDWAHDLVAESLDYGTMDTEVAAVPPGSQGILFAPYLMGERTPYWDANARGSFVGLSLHHTRSALLRSVYEGVAFALKDVLKVYTDLGIQPEYLTLLGGGSKSRVWRSIFSDIFALPIAPHSAPTNATSLGAAMAAAVGTGLYTDLDSATAMARILSTENPSPGGIETYQRIYPIYRKLYEALRPITNDLANIRITEEYNESRGN